MEIQPHQDIMSNVSITTNFVNSSTSLIFLLYILRWEVQTETISQKWPWKLNYLDFIKKKLIT